MRIFRLKNTPAMARFEVRPEEDGFSFQTYDEVPERPEGYREDDPATWVLPPRMALHPRHSGRVTAADLVGADDHALVAYVVRQSDRVPVWLTDASPLANLYALTMPTRAVPDVLLGERGLRILFAVMVPFRGSAPSEWGLCLPGQGGQLVLPDGAEAEEVPSLLAATAAHLPVLGLEAGERRADGLQLLHATLFDPRGGAMPRAGATVYFETTAGALMVQRAITSEAGVATAVVDLARVPAGTPFKVKVGFKHYAGLAELGLEA